MSEANNEIIMVLAELSSKIETLLTKQDEMALHVSKIKEAVYNPDTGLYARLTKLDTRIEALEKWKENNSKILWIVISVGVGLILTTAWRALTT